MKTIGDACFFHCLSLNDIVLPDSLQVIGSSAFDTSGLIRITISNSVTTIGNNCFAHCNRLQKVSNMSFIPQVIDPSVFSGLSLEDASLYVPAVAEKSYEDADVWNRFGTINPIE